MIDRKKILAAGYKFADAILASEDEEDLVTMGFEAGIKWYNKSMWHDVTKERPREYSLCVVEGIFKKNGLKCISYTTAHFNNGDFATFTEDPLIKIIRWCYIDSISPNNDKNYEEEYNTIYLDN